MTIYVQWGERAEALGWTAQDLFGLHDPPEQRGPNYHRLSRYDVIGLIWLLHGRPVAALTAGRAAIGTRGSGVTFYRMATQTTERHGESFESRRAYCEPHLVGRLVTIFAGGIAG